MFYFLNESIVKSSTASSLQLTHIINHNLRLFLPLLEFYRDDVTASILSSFAFFPSTFNQGRVGVAKSLLTVLHLNSTGSILYCQYIVLKVPHLGAVLSTQFVFSGSHAQEIYLFSSFLFWLQLQFQERGQASHVAKSVQKLNAWFTMQHHHMVLSHLHLISIFQLGARFGVINLWMGGISLSFAGASMSCVNSPSPSEPFLAVTAKWTRCLRFAVTARNSPKGEGPFTQ